MLSDLQDTGIKLSSMGLIINRAARISFRFLIGDEISYFGKRIKLDWNRGHSKKTEEEINFVVADPVHLEIPRSRGTWCRKG